MRVFLVIITVFLLSFSSKASDSLFLQGVEELRNENYAVAIEYFEKSIEETPSFASYYNLGIAYGNSEDWATARWAFESALKFQPNNQDAQYNAELALSNLSSNSEWTHPYSWILRLILGFGFYTWAFLLFISSISIGFILFKLMASSSIKEETKKWFYRIGLLAVVLFTISILGVYSYHQHFATHQYAITKYDDIPSFISPNGVESNEEISNGSRLELVQNQNEDWWLVLTENGEKVWVRTQDVRVY